MTTHRSLGRLVAVLVGIAGLVPASSQARGLIELTRDLNTDPARSQRAGGGAARPTPVGDQLFFAGRDNDTGVELWVSDGTEAGTRRVRDIHPGPSSSFPEEITDVAGIAFFVADDGVHGAELWRSDGTAEGTWLVRDIRRGPEESDTWCLQEFEGELLFNADDGIVASELWRSDGTPGGTRLVKDIRPGPAHGGPEKFTKVGDRVAFVATDDDHGRELWVTDGTSAGTQRISDIAPGPANSIRTRRPHDLVVYADVVYFSADDGVHGYEVWKSDLTPGGTELVADVLPGAASSDALPIVTAGDVIYLSVGDRELWATGPDGRNTRRIQENVRANRGEVAVLGGRLFFTASPQEPDGHQLWVTDGSAGGTELLVDVLGIAACSPRNFVRNLFTLGDRVYFAGRMPGGDEELWVSDGTVAGTHEVVDVVATGGCKPRDLTSLDDTLYFVADDGQTGFELWRSDGTAGGTRLVRDNFRSTDELVVHGPLAPWGDEVVFAGSSGVFRSDGTEEGTGPLPGTMRIAPPINVGPQAVGDTVLFWEPVPGGLALWRSDGTAVGLRRLETFPGAAGVSTVVLGTQMLFTTVPRDGGRQIPSSLWRTDGDTVERLRDFTGPGESVASGLFATSEAVYFGAATPEHGLELWRTDGTAAGTRLVRDANPGGPGLNASFPPPVAAGDLLYFAANDGQSGFELWRSDGTEAGTFPIVELAPGPQAGAVFASFRRGTDRGRLFFLRQVTAEDGSETTYELWVSDGSAAGTRAVWSLPEDRYPDSVVVLDDVAYLALRGDERVELWRSDGRRSGTRIVPTPLRDIQWLLATPRALYLSEDVFLVSGVDTRLWVSDGTSEGTRPMAMPDGDFLQLRLDTLVDASGHLYLLGDDGVHGMELLHLTCGNGRLDADEQCDLGARNGAGSCSLACERSSLGKRTFEPLQRRGAAGGPPAVRRVYGERSGGRLPAR